MEVTLAGSPWKEKGQTIFLKNLKNPGYFSAFCPLGGGSEAVRPFLEGGGGGGGKKYQVF